MTSGIFITGAVEQLVWYAKKMKISIETVMDTQDFDREMQALECTQNPRY
ncbi:hypothetical protein HSHS1_18270 [Helicobacter suis HS1]|nr:hypothetical protein [Helicobacter suis]BDR29066.1 hypothetical protein HSHS1_18270 [Helicobacter suis HS1]